jgi:hypothetical protein
MRLYEIEQALEVLVDPETGELFDFEQFEALQMERDSKIENMALWVKDLQAEANAIREEEKALAARRKARENQAERLKGYLGHFLRGSKFTSPKVAISYRKTLAVEVEEGFLAWAREHGDHFLTYKEPEISKTAIKEYLQAGNELALARLAEREALQIK